MRILRTFLILLFFSLIYSIPAARSQDEPGAVWQITKFDITANLPAAAGERSLTARAVLTVRNIGRGSGSTFSVRLAPKAEVKSVSVGDASATFRTREEETKNREQVVILKLQRVTISLPTPVAPNQSVNVAIDYRLPITENSGVAALSSTGSQFLPLSYWYPTHNSASSLRGADVAPLRLTINGAGSDTVISSGRASGSTFDQMHYSQPFFMTGSWDVSEGAGEA